MKKGGSASTIIIGPSKSVLVYALHSIEYVLGLARFRVFVPKLYYYIIVFENIRIQILTKFRIKNNQKQRIFLITPRKVITHTFILQSFINTQAFAEQQFIKLQVILQFKLYSQMIVSAATTVWCSSFLPCAVDANGSSLLASVCCIHCLLFLCLLLLFNHIQQFRSSTYR